MRSATLVMVFILFSFWVTAQDNTLKSDGRMWANYGTASQQSMFIKAAYVQGVIEGLRAGVATGYFAGTTDEDRAIDPDGACGAKHLPNGMTDEKEIFSFTSKRMMASLDKARNKVIPDNPGSILDIVRQTDKFYSNYRNTPVCMIMAVRESIQSLNGESSTEQELEIMRKAGCNK
jgi:hypothetical protein